jgi:hypothetical protein
MSVSAATPTTATIGTRNRSKKLFCWAYGRARSRRPARTLEGRVVAGRWVGDGFVPAEAADADAVPEPLAGWLTGELPG